jgi:hypothetical protein
MIKAMPAITRITHGKPPGGVGEALFLPRAGLNFGITRMVASAIWPRMAKSEGTMKRRSWVAAAAGLGAALGAAGCRKPAALPRNIFPESAAGGWRRIDRRQLSASEAPDPVPRNEIESLLTASYQGPGKLEARLYVLGSDVVGLELSQRWKPSADTVFFSRGPYFVVVKWQSAERTALQAFVREVEKTIADSAPNKE